LLRSGRRGGSGRRLVLLRLRELLLDILFIFRGAGLAVHGVEDLFQPVYIAHRARQVLGQLVERGAELLLLVLEATLVQLADLAPQPELGQLVLARRLLFFQRRVPLVRGVETLAHAVGVLAEFPGDLRQPRRVVVADALDHVGRHALAAAGGEFGEPLLDEPALLDQLLDGRAGGSVLAPQLLLAVAAAHRCAPAA
jgi:hypothetical protein